MHHFKAFDMINLQYLVKIFLIKPQMTKTSIRTPFWAHCALAYALWLKHAKDDMMQDKIEVTISPLVRGAERSTEFSKNLEKILKPSGFSGRNIWRIHGANSKH